MEPGTVYIVGAGPGDPELLTLKARRLIADADTVFHDALVGPDVLALIPRHAAENVGKRPAGKRTPQHEINRKLAHEARQRKTVVRLKGGDPGVFGRAGEEVEFLAERGIPYEIVPGVSSVLAGPASGGFPLTHRDHASSITVVTGHEDPTKDESALNWPALASSLTAGGTLVILMGVGRLPAVTRTLKAQGVAGETPVGIIERASLPDEFTLTGTLETIVTAAETTEITPPAVIVIGEVVTVPTIDEAAVTAAIHTSAIHERPRHTASFEQ